MLAEKPGLPEHYKCTGCRVCRDVCPKSAIEMVADKYGFFYPVINNDLCIGCRKCEKTCPIINPPSVNTEIREGYVGVHRSDEILNKSSSGGAFSAVISAWKPDAVCGVRWEGFEAVNDLANADGDLSVFSKSKYILSDTNDVFRKAADELKAGKRVLFSGSPCQLAAFKNYIEYTGKENLLLVDIVCHGAPSDYLLKMHLRELEQKTGKQIKSWTFRDKTPINGIISCRSARVDYKDGSWEHFEIDQDAYLRLYYARIAYREACGNCIFARPDRISDITVCDAHHVKKLFKEFSVNTGTSTLLIHTQKGHELLPELNKLMDLRKIEYSWALDHNEQLRKPTNIHPRTDIFYQKIDQGLSFDKTAVEISHRKITTRLIDKIKRMIRNK